MHNAYQQQYDSLTAEIEQLREDKRALLDGAKLPMEASVLRTAH